MTKDNKIYISKKKQNIKLDKKYNKKKNNDSDDDNEEEIFSSEDDESINENEINTHEYRKYILKKIFPSKYLNQKIKDGEKEKYKTPKKKYKIDDAKINYPPTKSKHKNEYENEYENENETLSVLSNSESSNYEETDEYESSENDDSNSEDDVIEVKNKKKHNQNYNIVLTIGKNKNEENYDEDYEDEEDCSDWEDIESDTENEDESVSSFESKESIKKTKNQNNCKIENNNEKEKSNKITKKINETQFIENDKVKKEDNKILIELLKETLTKCQDVDKHLIDDCLKVCEEKIEKNKIKKELKTKKQQKKNSRIFKKIVRDKNTLNDHSFFNNLEVEKQKLIIKEMRKVNDISRNEKPYRIRVLELHDIPPELKNSALKKISLLKYMDPGSGEYYKIKNWVDTFMRIPFSNYEKLNINIEDGNNVTHDFLVKSKQILDEAVYGLNDAKLQIIQMLGQLIVNPESIGTSIAIHGPPGTGKTSLVKDGISKILNRPFAFIALGGATDSSFLEGHSYTYEGSTWGKIVQILIDSKCMNPVIYFDELDKLSETPKGEEILNILVHLTDSQQNEKFQDKYFSEIEFNLKRCLLIFSYNDPSKISPVLLDRMYKIKTDGYSNKEKIIICNDYLLPKIRQEMKFKIDDIYIPNEVLNYLLEKYNLNEKGMRNIKRCLEIIYSKLNLFRLMKPETNLFKDDIKLNITFPITITIDIIDKLIKNKENMETSKMMMYI
jgi:ATP-dependent Lon protease